MLCLSPPFSLSLSLLLPSLPPSSLPYPREIPVIVPPWQLGTGAVLKSFLHSEEDRRFHAIHGRQYGSDGESMEATALGPATGVDWLLVDHLPPSSAAVTSLEIDFHRGLVYIGSMDGTICAVDFNERCARRLIGLPDTYFSFHNGLFEVS